MSERPNLAVQFINPAESGGYDTPVSQELPVKKPKLTIEQKQAIVAEAATGGYDDLVKVNKSGRLYNAAGNGNHSGKLVEMKRAEMIMAHADQIRDGLDEYAAAKSMHEAGLADSEIDLALASKRLSGRAGELEAAALAHLDEKYPSTLVVESDIQEDFRAGDAVTVRRTSGDVEDDWAVHSVSEDGTVTVVKSVAEGTLKKDISIDALKAMQEISGEAQEGNGSDVAIEAQEGESLSEYEARHGIPEDQRSTNDILDQIDREEGVAERSAADILDQIDREEAAVTAEGFGTGGEGGMSRAVETAAEAQANAEITPTVPQTIRERIRDALTPAGFAAEMSRLTSTLSEKLTKRKKVGIGLGVLAVAGVTAWALLNRDSGGSHRPGNGSFWTDALPTIDPRAVDDAGGAATAHAEFSSNAHNVLPGEGWYQTFADMNIPVSERAELLQKVGPKLQEIGVAYPMGDSYGISEPGNLSNDVLQLIQDSRQ